jgi:phospholipase/carboxylesterase
MVSFTGPGRACSHPRAVLVLHHGYGMYGDYFLQFLDRLNLPEVLVWCPQGLRLPQAYPQPLELWPEMRDDKGREWFDWGSLFWEHNARRQGEDRPLSWLLPPWQDFYGRLDQAGKKQSQRILQGLGDFCGPVFLAGFSQGAVMALHTGLHHLKVAGIVACSGFYLPSFQPGPYQPPVFLCHGRQDPLVPTMWMQQMAHELEDQGVPVQSAILEGVEHRFSDQAVLLARDFILGRLEQLGL